MYKIGDIVRVLPDSYRALIKRELRDPSAWQRADPINNKEVMLGGRYAVRRVYETRVGTFYGLIEYDCNHADRIRENFVVAEKDVSDCPYKVGDKVLFRPKCSTESILGTVDSLGGSETVHRVTAVINDYYILVDRDFNDVKAFPFRWIDFERA